MKLHMFKVYLAWCSTLFRRLYRGLTRMDHGMLDFEHACPVVPA